MSLERLLLQVVVKGTETTIIADAANKEEIDMRVQRSYSVSIECMVVPSGGL